MLGQEGMFFEISAEGLPLFFGNLFDLHLLIVAVKERNYDSFVLGKMMCAALRAPNQTDVFRVIRRIGFMRFVAVAWETRNPLIIFIEFGWVDYAD